MNEFDLLQFISPEIRLTKGLRRLLEEIRKVIAWYNLLYLEDPFEPWKVYWHGLTSNLDAKALRALAERMGILRLKNGKMHSQREDAEKLLDSLYKFDGDNYRLYTLLVPYDTETLLYLMAKANSEEIRRFVSNYFTRLKGTKIQLTGKDLVTMGFQSGPVFREIFDSLLEAHLNNLIKTREDEVRDVERNWTKTQHSVLSAELQWVQREELVLKQCLLR